MDSTALSAGSHSTDGRRWLALGVILAAVAMTFVDMFVVNVAIPSIQGDLDASDGKTQLVVAMYAIVYGAFLFLGGRLGDVFGRRKVFSIGVALFTLASFGASVVPSADSLIAMRGLQGFGAALMMPQVFSIIITTFDGADRNKAFGAFATVAGVSAGSAQLIGGALLRADLFDLGWRLVFLINIPIGIVATALILMYVPNDRPAQSGKGALDVLGATLLCVTLIVFVGSLTLGSERSARNAIWAAGAAGTVALATLFLRWERRVLAVGGDPILRMSLFRDRLFAAGNGVALLFYAGNAGLFLSFPLFLQTGLGYSPLRCGAVFAPMAVSFALSSNYFARHAVRIGYKLIIGGSSAIVVGIAILGFLADREPDKIVPWLILSGVIGIFGGMIQPTINVLTMQNVKPNDAGSASGVLSTSFEIGGGIGTVALGTLYFEVLGDSPSSIGDYSSAFVAGMILIGAIYTSIVVLALFARREASVSPAFAAAD
jgi:MFS family permease